MQLKMDYQPKQQAFFNRCNTSNLRSIYTIDYLYIVYKLHEAVYKHPAISNIAAKCLPRANVVRLCVKDFRRSFDEIRFLIHYHTFGAGIRPSISSTVSTVLHFRLFKSQILYVFTSHVFTSRNFTSCIFRSATLLV